MNCDPFGVPQRLDQFHTCEDLNKLKHVTCCGSCGLQRPLFDPPEQLLSLGGCHGVAALQQVCDNQGLLNAGGLDPHSAVHAHHQLTGEQLVQVRPDLAVGCQQSDRRGTEMWF